MLTKRLFVAACTILLSLCAILSYGQGRVVTGSVMDQNGGSLQGVTVTAKGTRLPRKPMQKALSAFQYRRVLPRWCLPR